MFKKNTAVTGFAFTLVNKADGSPITSGTVTGYYLLDGGTQGTIAGTPVHEGNGQWSVNLTAGEMNGDVVGLLFTHANAVAVHFTIRTTTQLVSECAPSSTALSNATWTDGKAGYLDAAISTRSTLDAATVWGYATRTLTGFGTLVADIWGYTTRALTDKAGFTISGTKQTLDVLNDITASSVWSVGSRTLTALGSSLVAEIWNALTSGMTTAGSIGKKLADWILGSDKKAMLSTDAQTGVIIPTVTAVTNDVGVTQAGADKVWSTANRTLTSFGTLIADFWAYATRSLTDKLGFSLAVDQSAVTIGTVNALGTQAKADVNAEVVDGLGVDVISELAQGQPPTTPTIKQALMLLYMALRNEFTSSATELKIRNNAATVIAKSTQSDSGSIYTREKMVSGP